MGFQIGIGLGLTAQRGGGLSLASLFANGEDGFLFGNFTDLTRQFQTSVGGLNVAADSDPAGLELDYHSWAGKTLAQVLAAQAELVTNGTFDSNLSGWDASASTAPSTMVWSNGQAVAQTDGLANARFRQSIPTVAGKTYRLALSGTYGISVGTTTGASDLLTGASGSSRPIAFFVAAGATTWLSGASANNGTTLDNVSVKLVPGNHALQATTTKRPAWKANSGKPYLIGDNADDVQQTPFVPTPALTMAVAVRATNVAGRVMGAGNSTDNTRASIGVGGAGVPTIGWGGSANISGSVVITNEDHVLLATGDATGVELYLDGVLAASASAVGTPGGTSGMVLMAASFSGTASNFFPGNLYSALALNRRVTASEIALITSQMRSTYQ